MPLYAGEVIPETQALETVRNALAQGVTLFDTAPAYGAGRSEQLLGQALADSPRDEYVLSTKVRREAGHYTAEAARRSLHQSLERLGTGYTDIFLIHDPDGLEDEALDAAYPEFQKLREEGLARLIGVGAMYSVAPLERFARDADCDVFLMAGHYTLLDQDGLELLNTCQRKGIGVMLGAALNTGILATGARPGARYNYREASPAILARVSRIEAVCARHATPLLNAALQFPLTHPAVSCVVVGAQSPAEVAANLAAVSQPAPPDLWAELQAEGLLPTNAPLPAKPGPATSPLSG
jgi:D-threo-aldose 1-dehydrogenase